MKNQARSLRKASRGRGTARDGTFSGAFKTLGGREPVVAQLGVLSRVLVPV